MDILEKSKESAQGSQLAPHFEEQPRNRRHNEKVTGAEIWKLGKSHYVRTSVNKRFGFYSESYERTQKSFEPREDEITLVAALRINHKDVRARKEV